jgi:hypothetical protein
VLTCAACAAGGVRYAILVAPGALCVVVLCLVNFFALLRVRRRAVTQQSSVMSL